MSKMRKGEGQAGVKKMIIDEDEIVMLQIEAVPGELREFIFTKGTWFQGLKNQGI